MLYQIIVYEDLLMPNPKLPPILINKAGSVYYVYTYKNIWDRELKRSKRGESKKIGTILGGQKEGKIRFDEAFLQEHPEFRNYQVERKGKDYVFTPISQEGITLEQARNIKKLHAGATWALDQIVADSPVGEFLKECFPRHKDYKKILSLAYFLRKLCKIRNFSQSPFGGFIFEESDGNFPSGRN